MVLQKLNLVNFHGSHSLISVSVFIQSYTTELAHFFHLCYTGIAIEDWRLMVEHSWNAGSNHLSSATSFPKYQKFPRQIIILILEPLVTDHLS